MNPQQAAAELSAVSPGHAAEAAPHRLPAGLLDDAAINFRLLQCLQALVIEGHVTRAAERLGMSQPKLSIILSRLRRITGDPLLVRTPTGMLPTDTARELATHADDFLARWRSTVGRERVFSPETVEHTFSVEATDYQVQELVVPVVRALRTIAPKVNISIRTPALSTMREDLAKGELDLVIGYIPQVPDDLFISHLWSYESCCVAAAEHPRIQGSLTFEDYVREGHVVPTFGRVNEPSLTERYVNGLLPEHHARRRAAVYVPSLLLVTEVVAHTELLGLVPRNIAQRASAGLRLQLLEPPFVLPKQDVVMIWHARTKNDPRNQWLRGIFRNVAQTLRAANASA